MALTLSYCIIIIIIPTFRYIRRPRHSAAAVHSLPTCPPSTWDMAAENSHLCIKLVRNTQHLIAKCYSTRGLCAMLLLKGTIRRMVSEQVRKSSWFLLFVTFRSVLIFSSAPDPELQCWSRPNLGWWSVPGLAGCLGCFGYMLLHKWLWNPTFFYMFFTFIFWSITSADKTLLALILTPRSVEV